MEVESVGNGHWIVDPREEFSESAHGPDVVFVAECGEERFLE